MGQVIQFFKRANPDGVVRLSGHRSFEFDIVGEASYQPALEEIFAGNPESSAGLELEAYLCYEDDNPYDNQAIRVAISGHTVGYLNRENARHYRLQMTEAGLAGMSARCTAKIVGGWRRDDGSRAYFGVRLDLPTKAVSKEDLP